MAGIRFTKNERLMIRNAFERCRDITRQLAWEQKAVESVLTKLDAAEVAPKKKAGGISVATAIEAFRGVLGRRLVLPPGKPGAGWYAQMGNRLAALGMTEELCRAAAQQAGHEWNGPIKAESIIRQADKLIHNYAADPEDFHDEASDPVLMLDDEAL